MATKTTAAMLQELAPGEFVTIQKIDAGGALQARKLSGTTAIQFYWRYTHGGKTRRAKIGTFDPGALTRSLSPSAHGYSITAAAREASRIATIQK